MHFNIPYTCAQSASNVQRLLSNPISVNDGHFLKKCREWFETQYPGYTAFMTTSCTRALELAALSLDLTAGDEIILSPFNYVGAGNAFTSYGATLVYVDTDPGTMNIDADLIEKAITSKTRAVLAMHYAGIPCDIKKIREICDRYGLICIEDNAQGIGVNSEGRPLGSIGDYSAISFDTLKNISCNEGGVLLCRQELSDKTEIAFSNGSNRTAFLRGEIKKYEWVAKGSKFTMNEYTAAVLYPLLERCKDITNERRKIWDSLYEKISAVEALRPYIPGCLINSAHNAHIAYLIFEDKAMRDAVMKFMNTNGVPCAFHYVPLNQSLAGKQFGREAMPCVHSDRESNLLLRLPMHQFLMDQDLDKIACTLAEAVGQAVNC